MRDPARSSLAAPAILVFLALLAPAAGAQTCKDDWVCVDTVRAGGNVELRARNLQPYPVTYTLRVRSRRLTIDGPATVTRTLGPQESAAALRLSAGEGEVGPGDFRFWFDWTVGDRDAIHDDDYLYALPYAEGRSYRVLQGFGSRFSHTGLEAYAVDFDMPVGTDVHAARDGTVARLQEAHDRGCWEDECGRYANYVVVLHDDGTTGEYYHLQKDGVLVEVGDRVTRGQRIALSGNTGHTTMPHLHFAVYRASEWGNTQSIPVRFHSADGVIVRPRRGGRYPAAHGNK